MKCRGIGRNPVGLVEKASEEIIKLLSVTKEQEIVNSVKNSALFYLSFLISKLGIPTEWVKFSDGTGESMVVSLKEGALISAAFSNDENPNGFGHSALELLKKYGTESQYLDDYFELFYEESPVYPWLLMEKKEILNEPKYIGE